ncbi:hypothetical protein EPA93_36495 [Ktedonosporobacter rubrisoli]|uniref:ABC transporter permease n=1 Tax=Ktedonosporobacter rubrisoli TaxID=2509675 RepID=A0A4P6K087_KTERU|nr:ABC transporter permease subunit [Ktedonosporobacter rubrisoli]QBD81182.1 hypothetical protein EPA93_36495 [Ktedonosporobacter rubrisoli]
MIWFIWRQYRIVAIIGLALLALLALILIKDGIVTHAVYQSSGMAACLAHGGNCEEIGLRFQTQAASQSLNWNALTYLMPWLPLAVGVFVGAPLIAREQEQRTHYFAWLQSVPRKRWLIGKLGLLIGATLLGFGLLTLLTTWWAQPWDADQNLWYLYHIQGLVLPAYALFALTLGIAIGTFVRHTVPAMALTFVLFLALFIGLSAAYPYLLPPMSTTYALHNGNESWGRPSDLVFYAGYADQQGHEIGEISTYCNVPIVNNSQYGTQINQCIRARHLQWKRVYQPPARFWPLQWIHTAILLVISAILVLLTFWRLLRRRH